MPKRRDSSPEEPPFNAPKLSEEAQIYVVTSLALWRPELEILKYVAEHFTPEGQKPISQQGLWFYNPKNVKCPERWRQLFAKTREEFVSRTAEIGIANPAYRLAERHRLYEMTVSKPAPNVVLAIEQLNDAARESGGAFTNRQRVEESGPNGGPIETTVNVVGPGLFGASDATAKATREELMDVIAKQLGGTEPKASKKRPK